VTPEAVAAEAAEIQRLSEERNVTVRLIGSLAIAQRCPGHRALLATLGRRPPRDVDLVAYARDERFIDGLLTGRGYALHPSVSHSREWGVNRLIYTDPERDAKVDVFLDRLVMAHTIDFAGRLEAEPTTVSLADLLLSKLQIYRITANDLIDLTVLLAEADLGKAPEQIGLDRLRSVLGNDWGFSFGAKLNLTRLGEEVRGYAGLDPVITTRVLARTTRLIDEIDAAPKSTRWRLRSRLGTQVAWHEHVEDVDV
jgi:hypothetical protein